MSTGPFVTFHNLNTTGYYKSSMRSKKVNGELVYENNPFVLSSAYARELPPNNKAMGEAGLAYFYLNPKDAFNGYSETKAVNLSKLYQKAFDEFSDKAWSGAQASLAVDLAERKETLNMLADTIGRLFKCALLVKQRRFREATGIMFGQELREGKQKGRKKSKKPPKSKAPDHKRFKPGNAFLDNWMAYRYGWTPMLGSIHGLCETIKKPVEDRGMISIEGRATGFDAWETFNQWTGQKRTKHKWVGRVKIGADVVVSDPATARLNQYGLVNPALVLWEIVPLSFVVDWFVPVGAILEDQTRFLGLSFSNGYVSYKCYGEDEFPLWASLERPSPRSGSVLKQRVPFTSFPPLPSRVASGLNPKRALDSLALLTSLLKLNRR